MRDDIEVTVNIQSLIPPYFYFKCGCYDQCVRLPSALQVGFEREEYSVMEEEEVVEVCVGRVGRSEVPVSILVATQELSMDQPQRATSKPTQDMKLLRSKSFHIKNYLLHTQFASHTILSYYCS